MISNSLSGESQDFSNNRLRKRKVELDLFVGQFLILGDGATTNLKSLSVSHSLVLSGTFHQNMKPIKGSSILHLHDIAHLVKTQNLNASNALAFSIGTQPRVSIENLGQFLSLSHSLKNEAGGTSSTLSLDHAVVVSASKGTNSKLNLSQSVTIDSVTRHFNIESTLNLSHGLSFYKPKRGFSQFVINIPTLQDVNFFLSGVVNETFRPPLFGNQDELSFQRVNRRSRGGDLTIFRDVEWPMTETLTLQFDFPNQKDADRLIKVMRSTIGQYVQYTDHEGTAWIAVIKNPDAPRVQSGRNSFHLDVVMEVEKVPTANVLIQDFLNLTQLTFATTRVDPHLHLVQTMRMNFTKNFRISHALTLSQKLDRIYFAENALSLIDYASCLNPLAPLALSQDVSVVHVSHRSLGQNLALSQGLDVFNNHIFIRQSLTLSQEVANNPDFCPELGSHPNLLVTGDGSTASAVWDGTGWTYTIALQTYTLKYIPPPRTGEGLGWVLEGEAATGHPTSGVTCNPFTITMNQAFTGPFSFRSPTTLNETSAFNLALSQEVDYVLNNHFFVLNGGSSRPGNRNLRLTQEVAVEKSVGRLISQSLVLKGGNDSASFTNPIDYLRLYQGVGVCLFRGDVEVFCFTPAGVLTQEKLFIFNEDSTTETLAFDSVPKIGHLLVAITTTLGNPAPVVTVGAYTQVGSSASFDALGNTITIAMWQKIATSADKHVTVTISSLAELNVALMEYAYSKTLDGSSANSGTSGSLWNTGTISVVANDMIVAGFVTAFNDMTGDFSPGSGYKYVLQHPDGTDGQSDMPIFVINKLSIVTSEDATADIIGGSVNFAAVGASFKNDGS